MQMHNVNVQTFGNDNLIAIKTIYKLEGGKRLINDKMK